MTTTEEPTKSRGVAHSSPRRGFAFCGSWSHGLGHEGGVADAQRAGGVVAGAQANSFALPASYVTHEPERRSPARPTREDGAIDV